MTTRIHYGVMGAHEVRRLRVDMLIGVERELRDPIRDLGFFEAGDPIARFGEGACCAYDFSAERFPAQRCGVYCTAEELFGHLPDILRSAYQMECKSIAVFVAENEWNHVAGWEYVECVARAMVDFALEFRDIYIVSTARDMVKFPWVTKFRNDNPELADLIADGGYVGAVIKLPFMWAFERYCQEVLEDRENKSRCYAFLESQGIEHPKQLIQEFRLGWVPKSKEEIRAWAETLNLSQEYYSEEIRDYLVAEVSRFCGRMLIPMENEDGDVVGFIGRNMGANQSLPRYIASPESEIFDRADVVYGLRQSVGLTGGRTLRKVIVCEGQLDVWRLYDWNVCPAVCGIQHAKQAARVAEVADKAVFLKEGSPGGMASDQTKELLEAAGVKVFF